MERLGPSLHKAMSHKKSKPRLASSLFFSLEEVVSIGTQVVSALQLLHDNGLVHRDVQPGNIVYDLAEKRVLLIDYGAARKCRETRNPKDSDLTSDMVGSPVFTSLNSHSGNASTLRDDLESLGYVLVYLYRGKLPWHHLGPDAIDQFIASKSSITMEDSGDKLEPFDEYFQSVNQLVPDGRPDYAGLQKILEALVQSIPISELI
ncbi:hypothetical protein N7476_005101 [Penicillium atrosanguineum]|uniref:Protein kinase domain-containing protein n=1 Tax=Penicillium atrosanguineum TaxID=1132637 RepID=A0A9W9PYT5_9EURO|nr:hypothetical protein N7476_005101 [Penicillium atrosanguineum]